MILLSAAFHPKNPHRITWANHSCSLARNHIGNPCQCDCGIFLTIGDKDDIFGVDSPIFAPPLSNSGVEREPRIPVQFTETQWITLAKELPIMAAALFDAKEYQRAAKLSAFSSMLAGQIIKAMPKTDQDRLLAKTKILAEGLEKGYVRF